MQKRKCGGLFSVVTISIALSLTAALAGAAEQEGPVEKKIPSPSTREGSLAEEYWSPERMKEATPMPLLKKPKEGADRERAREGMPSDAKPGFAPGSPPTDVPKGTSETTERAIGDSSSFQPQTAPPFSPPANPTDFANYGPFQRFTWTGDYRIYPVSTIGKLFFTQGGRDFVCSASVINRNTLATAGHCVHSGNGQDSGWSTNVRFCPSFNRNTGVDPTRGCWLANSMTTSRQWFNGGDSDRDYACIVTRPAGTVVPNNVGNVTGWLGRAWNWPSRQATFAWGYPAAAPFRGSDIITATSTEWYEVNMSSGDGQVSKYIGNDMTGGSSGGPWWLNMVNANVALEFPDTDGSIVTDPAQMNCCPWINGVNSHKRCNQNGCPSTSIFSQEMGSPQFRNTANDINESEDVFTVCFNNGGA